MHLRLFAFEIYPFRMFYTHRLLQVTNLLPCAPLEGTMLDSRPPRWVGVNESFRGVLVFPRKYCSSISELRHNCFLAHIYRFL